MAPKHEDSGRIATACQFRLTFLDSGELYLHFYDRDWKPLQKKEGKPLRVQARAARLELQHFETIAEVVKTWSNGQRGRIDIESGTTQSLARNEMRREFFGCRQAHARLLPRLLSSFASKQRPHAPLLDSCEPPARRFCRLGQPSSLGAGLQASPWSGQVAAALSPEPSPLQRRGPQPTPPAPRASTAAAASNPSKAVLTQGLGCNINRRCRQHGAGAVRGHGAGRVACHRHSVFPQLSR